MNSIHHILTLIIVSTGITLFGQNSLSPTVIGSQGNSVSSSAGNSLQYTIGEAIILTSTGSAGNMLTQGFNQPTSILNSNPLTAHYTTIDATCIGVNDGAIILDSISGCDGNYTINFNGNAVNIGDTVHTIGSGEYNLSVSSLDGCSLNETITISNVGVDCEITIYNAFSPNGDNSNDLWIIDLVEGYPENHVSIYDRWGVLSWEGNGYDNVNIVWDGKNTHGIDLPDGTYFYIFQSNELVLKGFVEITR